MDVSLARCAAVWLAATGACLASSRWAWHDLRGWSSFDTALPGIAALALIGCVVWAWWVTTVVVVGAVRRRSPCRTGRTGWLHQLALAACGLAALGGAPVIPAAAAADPSVLAADRGAPEPGIAALAGLSLPSRTTHSLRGGPAGAARLATADPDLQPRPARAAVRRGDSLWSIAESLLPAGAPPCEVTDLMHQLHDLNRAEIGPDPDLIHPGHQLRTPLGARPTR